MAVSGVFMRRRAPRSAPRVRAVLPIVCAVLSVVGACYSPNPRPGAPCVDDDGCPTGQACIQAYCGGPPDVVIDADVDAPPVVDAAIDAPPPECVVDEDCVAANTCESVACVDNMCVATTRPDGALCGTTAAQRCCSGTCVNISSDEANCGGCGQKCAPGRTCESVSVTNSCPQAPAATTGRCTCAGANAECPDGQICRNQTPYTNRCTPSGAANCAPGQIFVDVNLCPNFCRYP